MANQASPGVPGYLFLLLLALLVIIALASLATALLTMNLDATLEELEAGDYSNVATVGAVSGDGPKFDLKGRWLVPRSPTSRSWRRSTLATSTR